MRFIHGGVKESTMLMERLFNDDCEFPVGLRPACVDHFLGHSRELGVEGMYLHSLIETNGWVSKYFIDKYNTDVVHL